MPNLFPVKSALRDDRSSSLLTGLNTELLEAQIKINAKVMEEIDALKEERKAMVEEKNRMMALNEQLAKEKRMFGVKLAHTTEQLEYLKKKVDKRDTAGHSKENQCPNPSGLGTSN